MGSSLTGGVELSQDEERLTLSWGSSRWHHTHPIDKPSHVAPWNVAITVIFSVGIVGEGYMLKKNIRLLTYCYYTLLGSALLALVACSASGTGQRGGSPTPTFAPGKAAHILVQLFHAPGFIYPSINGVPEWTLYGDGTLLFQGGSNSSPGSGLLEAHLSNSQVNQILDVVVNQHHFFTGTRSLYGRTIPDSGITLLNVTAHDQHRVVALGNEPGPNVISSTTTWCFCDCPISEGLRACWRHKRITRLGWFYLLSPPRRIPLPLGPIVIFRWHRWAAKNARS